MSHLFFLIATVYTTYFTFQSSLHYQLQYCEQVLQSMCHDECLLDQCFVLMQPTYRPVLYHTVTFPRTLPARTIYLCHWFISSSMWDAGVHQNTLEGKLLLKCKLFQSDQYWSCFCREASPKIMRKTNPSEFKEMIGYWYK